MGKNKNNKMIHKKKRQTAITFNAEERTNYLKNMIGAKKRRKQFYIKKSEQQQKEVKKQ